MSLKFFLQAPSLITNGLKVWWDHTDTNLMTRVGNRIDQLNDKSGNGNHLVTSSFGTSWNPSFNQSLFSGRGGAAYNFAGKFLFSTAAIPALTCGAYTTFAVVRKNSMNGFGLLYDQTSMRVILGNAHGNRLGEFDAMTGAYGMAVNTPLVFGSVNNAGTVRYFVNNLIYPTFTGSGVSGGAAFGKVNLNWPNSGALQFDGDVGAVLIYNRVLLDAEIRQVSAWLQFRFGIRPQAARAANLIYDGNSIVFGYATSYSSFTSLAAINAGLTEYDYLNYGQNGQNFNQMLTSAVTRVDPNYNSAFGNKNIVCAFEITNSLEAGYTVAQIKTQITSYVSARQAVGFKVVLLTCLPRTSAVSGFESNRQLLNAWVLAGSSGANYICDVGGDATIGAPGANTNVTYYADGIHPTDAASIILAGLLSPVLSTALAA